MAKAKKSEPEEVAEAMGVETEDLPGKSVLADLVEALNETVGLLKASLKEANMAIESQKIKLNQLNGDFGKLAGLIASQYSEPMRTRIANIVIHHKAPVIAPPEPTSSVSAKK